MGGEGQVLEGQGEQVFEGGDRDASAGDTRRLDGYIPKHRFDEVNTKYQELKKLSDELRALGITDKASAEALRKRVDEMSGDRKFTDKEREALRKELLEIAPELGDYQRSQQIRRQALLSQSVKRVDKYLTEIGLEVTPRANKRLQDILAAELGEEDNQERLQRYLSGDLSALDEIWPSVKKMMGFGSQKRKMDAAAEAIKRGTVQPKQQPKQQDKAGREGATETRDALNEAGDRAFEMLAALEE